MDLRLSGRLALVTGASAGIGKTIARSLVEERCRVILNARRGEPLHDAAKSVGATDAIVADVSTEDGVAYLVDQVHMRHGRLDILICNVGSGSSRPGLEETASDWEAMLRINLLSTSMMVRAAAPMLEKSSGCVVCISSICGLEAMGCPLGYSAAKAALNSYVRGAARPLAKRRIRINAVAPGNIYFPGSTWERKLLAEPKEVEGMIQRDVPLGRFGSTEEVAACVAFLASAQAGFVTGEILVVDGGQVRG